MQSVNVNYFNRIFWSCRRGRMVEYFQLSMQSVHITTKVVSLNPANGKVYSMQHYVLNLSVTCGGSLVFSGYSGFLHQ
jgi:hypothetical protein